MEFLQGLTLIAIPNWVKRIIFFVTVFIGLINTYLFISNFFVAHSVFMTESAVDLLSAMFPFFVILMILWKSESGIVVLQDYTRDYLSFVLPNILKHVHDEDNKFNFVDRKKKLSPRPQQSIVVHNMKLDQFYCDYVINITNSELMFIFLRIELNVHKINVNLCFPQEQAALKQQQGKSALSDVHTAAELMSKLKHSYGGATGSVASVTNHIQPQRNVFHYSFNEKPIRRKIAQHDFLCLVSSIELPENFLLSASHKLFFAQDLLLFIRSCITEAPELFNVSAPFAKELSEQFAKPPRATAVEVK